jgi:ABC-type phosphate/phosphonate transport system substrate-binding protein
LQLARWLITALWMLGLGLFMPVAFPGQADEPAVLHIGLVDSLVKDLAPGRRDLIDHDFPALVRDFTGLKSKVFQGGSPFTADKKLAQGQWHLAVLQGVEFAWVQAQDAKLRPLLVAINRQRYLHALLVAKKDSPAKGFADLKGKAVYVQPGREHCRLFADKGAGGNASTVFKVTPAKNVEMALDDVLRSKLAAAVVDENALELYKQVNPGRFGHLKVLAKSEAFPPMVIAYRQGALGPGTLDKLRTGMLRANDSEKGREAMSSARITAFEPVPADFPKRLQAIAKAYPPPSK